MIEKELRTLGNRSSCKCKICKSMKYLQKKFNPATMNRINQGIYGPALCKGTLGEF
jgi:hypothetical protein